MLAAEQPDLHVYWVDPGDMRTQMHQEAFPGEDISDRPPPEDSVPGLLVCSRRAPERAVPRHGAGAGEGRVTASVAISPAPLALPEAHRPPEARGMARDAVRMMVAHRATGTVEPSARADLPASSTPATSWS